VKCKCVVCEGRQTICIDGIKILNKKVLLNLLNLVHKKSCEHHVNRIHISLSNSNINLDLVDVCKFPDYLLHEEIFNNFHYSVFIDKNHPALNDIRLLKTNVDVKNLLYNCNIDFKILSGNEKTVIQK
jgi:hypothetical protein